MSFLSGVVAQVIQWLLTKTGEWISSVFKRAKKDGQINDAAKDAVEPLKKAQTDEEIRRASEDALRKT